MNFTFRTIWMTNGADREKAPGAYEVLLDSRPMGEVDRLYGSRKWIATDPEGIRLPDEFPTRTAAAAALDSDRPD